jgi:uncharacterized protein YkwD
MYRVAISAALGVLLGACSLDSSSLTTGFAESSDTAPSVRSAPAVESVALGGEPSTHRADTNEAVAPTRLAKLEDKAPMGSFERAPAGALADRDYSKTALDLDRARDLINQYRHDKGLKPLQLNAQLTEAAKAHSRDLAQWDRISHYGSDGSNPWDRVKRAGYHARLAAENVGTGQVDFQEVLRGWKESPGHNKNLLLPDATHMGIALVQDPKTEFKSFWTLVIGASM